MRPVDPAQLRELRATLAEETPTTDVDRWGATLVRRIVAEHGQGHAVMLRAVAVETATGVAAWTVVAGRRLLRMIRRAVLLGLPSVSTKRVTIHPVPREPNAFANASVLHGCPVTRGLVVQHRDFFGRCFAVLEAQQQNEPVVRYLLALLVDLWTVAPRNDVSGEVAPHQELTAAAVDRHATAHITTRWLRHSGFGCGRTWSPQTIPHPCNILLWRNR